MSVETGGRAVHRAGFGDYRAVYAGGDARVGQGAGEHDRSGGETEDVDWAPVQHLYTVLFGGVQAFDPAGPVATVDPIRPLLDAMDRARSAAVLTGDPTAIALSLWVTLHGLVTLELAGALDSATADRTFDSTVPAVLRGWRQPPAGDR